MTEFYIPKTAHIKAPDGQSYVVVEGIREVPDALANLAIANQYMKPVHEMTADERAKMKLPPAPPDVDESLKVEPEAAPEAKQDVKAPLLIDSKPASSVVKASA